MFRRLRRRKRRLARGLGAAKLARAARRGSGAAKKSLRGAMGAASRRTRKPARGVKSAAKKLTRGVFGAVRGTASKMVKKPLRRPRPGRGPIGSLVGKVAGAGRKGLAAAAKRAMATKKVGRRAKGAMSKMKKKVTRRGLFGALRGLRGRFDAGGRYEQKMMMGGKMTGADKDFMGGGMMKKSYKHGGMKKDSYKHGGKMKYPGGGHMRKPKSGGSYRQLD